MAVSSLYGVKLQLSTIINYINYTNNANHDIIKRIDEIFSKVESHTVQIKNVIYKQERYDRNARI